MSVNSIGEQSNKRGWYENLALVTQEASLLPEIFVNIFLKLDPESHKSWILTCKSFRKIAYKLLPIEVPYAAFPSLKYVQEIQKMHFQEQFKTKPTLKQELTNLTSENIDFRWVLSGSKAFALEKENADRNFLIVSFDLATEELKYFPEISLNGEEIRNFLSFDHKAYILSRKEEKGLYLQELNLKENYIKDFLFIPKVDVTAPSWTYLFRATDLLVLGYELPEQSFKIAAYHRNGHLVFEKAISINVLSFMVLDDALFFADGANFYYASIDQLLSNSHAVTTFSYPTQLLFKDKEMIPLKNWLTDQEWIASPKHKLGARQVIQAIHAANETMVYFSSVVVSTHQSNSEVKIHAWDFTTGKHFYSLESTDPIGNPLESIAAFGIGKGKLFGMSSKGKIYTWEYINIPLEIKAKEESLQNL